MIFNINKKGMVGIIEPKLRPDCILSIELDELLSYAKLGIEFMPNPQWGIVRLYRTKTSKFPWGLVDMVVSVFKKYNISYKINGDFNPLVFNVQKFKTLNPMLRQYQRDAILSLIINNGGVLSMATGAGKTFTAIEFIKYCNLKTIVLAPTNYIVDQWKEYIKDCPTLYDVKTYSYATRDKELVKGYDLIINDETHKVAAKTIYTLLMKCGHSKIVGLTATPFREDKEDLKIFAACGKIVYDVKRKYLIDNGYLSNAKVYYIKLSKNKNDKYVQMFMDYNEIKNVYLTNNDERNRIIIKIIKHNLKLGKRILCLFSLIEHGENLSTMLNNLKIKHRIIDGNTSKKKRKINDEDRIILGSNIFNEGFDLPSLDCLILAGGGKSSIQTIQKVGRVLRKKASMFAIVYDFIDNAKYLSAHAKKRKKLISMDFECEDIEISLNQEKLFIL